MRRERTTADLLVLIVAGTVCGAVAFTLVAVVLLAFFRPEGLQGVLGKTTAGVADVVNTLIGLLAGFLAGRTQGRRDVRDPDIDTPQEEE